MAVGDVLDNVVIVISFQLRLIALEQG